MSSKGVAETLFLSSSSPDSRRSSGTADRADTTPQSKDQTWENEGVREHCSRKFLRIAEIINKFEVQNVEIVLEIAKLGQILIKYC